MTPTHDMEHGPDTWEPPGSTDQYLPIPGTNVVATDALRRAQDNLEDVLAAKAMMCAYGDAGTGKSLSVNAVLHHIADDATVRVQFRARPTARDVRHALFQALALAGEPPRRPIEFDFLLKAALSERFRVLVCDEAQWMSRECFEYWRFLWDDPGTDIAIVFVGGGDCYQVLRREPMLSSRMYIWQEFRRLSRKQVVAAMPAYHRIWANAGPNLIKYTDAKAAHGNFRNWAKITSHALRGMEKAGTDHVDKDIVDWVFSRLGGRK